VWIRPCQVIAAYFETFFGRRISKYESLQGFILLSRVLWAYIIYFHILKVAGATNLLLVTFLIPVSAVLLGTSFLGEVLETSHVMGMAVIALGLAGIDGRLFRRPS